LLPQFGLTAFVALHQDVWSRYAGGSGAPAWTLEHAGFDLYGLEESGAAWLRGVCGGGHSEEERGLWPCGYQKLAAATMAWVFVVAVTKGALQWLSLMSVPVVVVVQDVLLGWRYVRSEAPRAGWYFDPTFLARCFFGYVGDCGARRRRP
jgi:hypothetical protein